MSKQRYMRENLIGLGSKRAVYDLGNGTVLKVAISRFGIKSNRKEVNYYRLSSGKIRKHLGKIYNYDSRYHWIIMRKYSKSIPKSKNYYKRVYKLKYKFNRYGIIPYEVTFSRNKKPNYKNIRLNRKGKIIVIDYGNFEYMSGR